MIILTTTQSERGAHRIGLASTCLRKYAYVCADRENGIDNSASTETPLIQGSMLHLVLAHHYVHKAFADGAPVVEACDQTLTDRAQVYKPLDALHEAAKTMPGWGLHVSLIESVYNSYVMQYGAEANWQVLAVEQTIRARIPGLPDNRNLYTQRADLIIKDEQTGRVFIIDHKKAYAIISKTADQYILHGQFLGYQRLGTMQYGQDFGGVILNRVRLNPYEAQRSMIGQSPAAVARYVTQLRSIENIVEHCEGQYGPPETHADNWPGAYHEEACFGKHGKCRYFDRCRFGG